VVRRLLALQKEPASFATLAKVTGGERPLPPVARLHPKDLAEALEGVTVWVLSGDYVFLLLYVALHTSGDLFLSPKDLFFAVSV
jgi:hypothetical protein